jgi:hypothetical protein
MPKASSNKRRRQPADTVQAAARSMREIAERSEADSPDMAPEITDEMRAAAAAFGRMGGKIGGARRAEKLTKARRKEIAEKAAAARWKTKPK